MKFVNLVEQVLRESNVAGGSMSAFGPNVTSTATSQSGDNFAREDSRVIKPLYAGVMSRVGLINTKNAAKSKSQKKKPKNRKKKQ